MTIWSRAIEAVRIRVSKDACVYMHKLVYPGAIPELKFLGPKDSLFDGAQPLEPLKLPKPKNKPKNPSLNL